MLMSTQGRKTNRITALCSVADMMLGNFVIVVLCAIVSPTVAAPHSLTPPCLYDSVQFVPDGRLAVTCDTHGNCEIWNVRSGHKVRRLPTSWPRDGSPEAKQWQPSAIGNVVISPNGEWLVGGCADGSLRIWELPVGRPLRALPAKQKPVSGLAFCPDGVHLLVSRSGGVPLVNDRTYRGEPPLELWNLSKGRVVRALAGFTGDTIGLGVAPDGRQALSVTYGGECAVWLWDLETGKAVRRLLQVPLEEMHVQGRPTQAFFTPDGHSVLIAGMKRGVLLVDPATGNIQRTLAKKRWLGQAAFCRGDCWLAAVTDRGFGLWHVRSGKCLWEEQSLGEAHRVAVSADGNYLMTITGGDGSGPGDRLTLWDLRRSRMVRTLTGFPPRRPGLVSVAFSRDGTKLITADRAGRLVRWNIQTGDRSRIGHPIGNICCVCVAATDLRAEFILCGTQHPTGIIGKGSSGLLELWCLTDPRSEARFDRPSLVESWRSKGYISAIALSGDGKRAVAGSSLGELQLLSLEPWPGRVLRTVQPNEDAVSALAFAEGGKSVVVAYSGADKVVVYDTEQLKAIRTISIGTRWVTAFTPDGRWAVVGGSGLRVFDVMNSRLHRVLGYEGGKLHAGVLAEGGGAEQAQIEAGVLYHSVAISADGRYILAGGKDGKARLWEVGRSRLIREFVGTGVPEPIENVAFSPDGQWAASAGAGGTLILWDVKTGKEVRTFDPLPEED